MNKITKIALALMTLVTMSCVQAGPEDKWPAPLEVNTNNISGKWELVEWNGAPLADGTYVFIELVRNDKTYTLYQNLDSFADVPHVITGSYNLMTDPELGAIIRGSYDHDSGDWAHRYIIRDLYENEMFWVAKDDPTFSQKFVRVDSIPVE